MKIAIAADHAGFDYKFKLVDWLKSQGHHVLDFGTNSADSCDYPDYAYPAAEAVVNHSTDYGIIICGTGIGMSMVANKVQGIRAANCMTPEMARLARLHNNANVLTFGARLISIGLAQEIITTFLNTGFEGGRHTNRVEKIHLLTDC
ncbi:MAG: ribose 5-phosphate isomerase B [Ignavibacteria bacterium GWB2_35_12]|nr:MAG: ribose 5-phosphate isomerase B [Ignavibacteria bacterium GWA2_35_8]OGU41801.1 MAG: ribose 5-phosphate isomerase B [Ignavibacteria bacterium GWB2_35_12]OGU92597.1 MAG: ribose 5-phosphate isomerase B [Ignavibacteria bacterium RIFOXYA2_FULL_35_10]OGV24339.1 MAG: ribose 5-phosphate isomerase B [Ignavibacteria bacterium RIFOXYC2_FULL_35_21]